MEEGGGIIGTHHIACFVADVDSGFDNSSFAFTAVIDIGDNILILECAFDRIKRTSSASIGCASVLIMARDSMVLNIHTTHIDADIRTISPVTVIMNSLRNQIILYSRLSINHYRAGR